MTQKMMKDKVKHLEKVLTSLQKSIDKEKETVSDKEDNYVGKTRKFFSVAAPDWVVDYWFEIMVPLFDKKIKPYNYHRLTSSDLIRNLIYAAILNPESIPLSSYDEIKHLKDK